MSNLILEIKCLIFFSFDVSSRYSRRPPCSWVWVRTSNVQENEEVRLQVSSEEESLENLR